MTPTAAPVDVVMDPLPPGWERLAPGPERVIEPNPD